MIPDCDASPRIFKDLPEAAPRCSQDLLRRPLLRSHVGANQLSLVPAGLLFTWKNSCVALSPTRLTVSESSPVLQKTSHRLQGPCTWKSLVDLSSRPPDERLRADVRAAPRTPPHLSRTSLPPLSKAIRSAHEINFDQRKTRHLDAQRDSRCAPLHRLRIELLHRVMSVAVPIISTTSPSAPGQKGVQLPGTTATNRPDVA